MLAALLVSILSSVRVVAHVWKGHYESVAALIQAGADVDQRDDNLWTPLIWAASNHHVRVAELLLDHGASLDVMTRTGRTAWDFVARDPLVAQYAQDRGLSRRSVATETAYSEPQLMRGRNPASVSQEARRRLFEESAANLEVDLASLGSDESAEV